MSFRFEPLAEQHLELLADWLSRPHVTEWWGKPPSIGELRDKYLRPVGTPGAARPYIAFLEDEPVGYIQSYVAMDFGTGWWPGATDPTVLGIDQFLADEARLGQGLGARMIRAFTRALFQPGGHQDRGRSRPDEPARDPVLPEGRIPGGGPHHDSRWRRPAHAAASAGHAMNSAATPRLLGLPYDASSSYLRGAAEAPPLIRAALHSAAGNDWTERLQNLAGPGGLSDGGDLALTDLAAEARSRIEAGIGEVFAGGWRPISLGGDHSVTYPILRAVHRVHPRPTVLQVDAHGDLYDEFEGDRFSHACPFARIMEEGLIDRLVQVGIRTMNPHQREQANRFGVEVIDMPAWSAGARPVLEGPVYISIDLDGLDPAYVPGVSHWEPGGLSVRDVLGLVQGAGGFLIGADVVEYNPRRDPSGMTAMVAAKLVKELAGRMMAANGAEQ